MFEPKKCCGCRTCELICSYKREEVFNPSFSRIRRVTLLEELEFIPLTCMQCEDAPCIEACPSGALNRDENGIIKINYDQCIGCKMCVITCPFGNVIATKNKVIKCELCNGEPECVKHCPASALTYVERERISSDKSIRTAEKLIRLFFTNKETKETTCHNLQDEG